MSVLPSSLRTICLSLTPSPVIRVYRRRRLLARARELVALSARHETVRAFCKELWRYDDFRPLQIISEAEAMFEEVQRRRPTTVLEIGAARGGTAFLFTRTAAPDATILTMDLEFQDGWPEAIAQFAHSAQNVTCIEGDSHSDTTKQVLTSHLGKRKVDVLFIDGDHSYEGVEQDFIAYSPLVAEGGLIVFHDIVDDSTIRHGVSTGTYVGGVPLFWRQIRSTYEETLDIIEDPDQDGYGIGMLTWPGARVPAGKWWHRGNGRVGT